MIKKIEEVLEQEVKPILMLHEGGVEFLSYDALSGTLRVKMTGHCSGCPSAQITVEEIIAAKVKEWIPQIRQVVLVNQVSYELLDMAKKILHHDTIFENARE